MACLETLNLERCNFGKFSHFKNYILKPLFNDDGDEGEYKPF
jgi:hypothetical protein